MSLDDTNITDKDGIEFWRGPVLEVSTIIFSYKFELHRILETTKPFYKWLNYQTCYFLVVWKSGSRFSDTSGCWCDRVDWNTHEVYWSIDRGSNNSLDWLISGLLRSATSSTSVGSNVLVRYHLFI